MFQLYRRHNPVPAIPAGWKSLYFGDSISDKWNLVGGVTQGKYRDTIDALFGFTRLGEGNGQTLDYTRAAISGRMTAAGQQIIAAELVPVQCCLAYLPDIVFLELGTNDWVFVTDTLTPTTYAATWDTLFAALTANVAVKSVQAVVPSARITAGTYKITQGANSTASAVNFNDSAATITTKLAAATPSPIPFTASVGLISDVAPNPIVLTANAAGAQTALTLTAQTGITGGTITVGGGLGGTPAVKMICLIGTRDYSGFTPTALGRAPTWASSIPGTFFALDAVTQAAWRKWNGRANGIPVCYADLRDIPDALLIDHTHPTDPAGTAYYADRIRRALTMAD